MRAKKTKLLRHLARSQTPGWPERKYQQKIGGSLLDNSGTIELIPQCTRAVYQQMKRIIKKRKYSC